MVDYGFDVVDYGLVGKENTVNYSPISPNLLFSSFFFIGNRNLVGITKLIQSERESRIALI